VERTFSISQKVVRLKAPGIVPNEPGEAPVNDRAGRIPGYKLTTLQALRVLMVGCGGLGGEIAHGLVRNGIGQIMLCDHDTVELSNLNRQRFYADDLYKNKALQLAKNLLSEAVQPLAIVGLAMTVEDAISSNYVRQVDAIVCGVDNDPTRVQVARWALTKRIPVIFLGVNDTADYGYVFVQTSQPNDPCFGCLFPDALGRTGAAPCAAGATVSILKTVAGPALYALSAIFMPDIMWRWRYKEIFLSGAGQDGNREIVRRTDCGLCGRLAACRRGGLSPRYLADYGNYLSETA